MVHGFRPLTIIRPKTNSCLRQLLGVGLLFQHSSPPFVILAPPVLVEVVGIGEVLGALDTIELT